MAWLLIDNSNTRTKFRLGDARGLCDWHAIIPTAELDADTIRALLKDVDFSAVVVASVVPEKEAVLRSVFGSGEYHQLTSESPLGYGFELEAPEQIGHDRLANLIALKEKHQAPSVVIDFGTAVTFSVLSAAGNFAGGVIAAGADCLSECLASRTAQLPVVKMEHFNSALGKTTLEALTVGATAAQRGMVKEILRVLSQEVSGDFFVVATGGGAEFAAEGISEIDEVDTSITLEGLRLLAARVFQ